MSYFFSSGGSVCISGVTVGGRASGSKVYEDRNGEVFTGSNITCRRVRNCTHRLLVMALGLGPVPLSTLRLGLGPSHQEPQVPMLRWMMPSTV